MSFLPNNRHLPSSFVNALFDNEGYPKHPSVLAIPNVLEAGDEMRRDKVSKADIDTDLDLFGNFVWVVDYNGTTLTYIDLDSSVSKANPKTTTNLTGFRLSRKFDDVLKDGSSVESMAMGNGEAALIYAMHVMPHINKYSSV